jgi:NADH-quinone oxidoreductase subunit L
MSYLLAIPLLPALVFVVFVLLPRRVRTKLLLLPIAAMTGSLLLSVIAFASAYSSAGEHGGASDAAAEGLKYTLGTIGGAPLDISLRLDAVAAFMLLVVTIVGIGVQVYSLYYMKDEERIGWYYAVLSLFTAAMLALVLAGDFLLFYVSWEIMGLCSYLLIGFWHNNEEARRASAKAFLTTRVGDVGFAIALALIWVNVGTFDIATVLAAAPTWAPGVATAVALLLLFGAMGKSAQVPLHVWLPDAMAGPTPASALIHAATMVAAGVLLVARALPIFEVSQVAMTVTLTVGVITAVVGGLLAAVQHDIKKVLAYSTISQLGLMFVALGAGSATAALFHLTTHAFFKSLLFLGAGVIIHAAHTQDMREMGGLGRQMPVTSVLFGTGALALAGVPPLSGFFSKDEILAVLLHEHHYVAFGFVVLASGLTAFYVARLWFRVFSGPEQSEHLHEGHPLMLAPMVLLAFLTLIVGFTTTRFASFLGHEGEWPSLMMLAISVAVAGTGFGAGWWFYGRRSMVVNTGAWKRTLGHLYAALVHKLYFDLTYDFVFIRGYFALARFATVVDEKAVDGVVNGAGRAWTGLSAGAWRFDGAVVDGAVNGLAVAARWLGTMMRRIQTGRLQSYQRLTVAAVVLMMLVLVLTRGT